MSKELIFLIIIVFFPPVIYYNEQKAYVNMMLLFSMMYTILKVTMEFGAISLNVNKQHGCILKYVVILKYKNNIQLT